MCVCVCVCVRAGVHMGAQMCYACERVFAKESGTEKRDRIVGVRVNIQMQVGKERRECECVCVRGERERERERERKRKSKKCGHKLFSAIEQDIERFICFFVAAAVFFGFNDVST